MLKLYYVNHDVIKIKEHIIQFFVSLKFQKKIEDFHKSNNMISICVTEIIY